MKRIVLIIPYFGSFRSDFQFWLKSVSDNQTVDFLLFTDNKVDFFCPNLKVIRLTFDALRKHIQSFFDFKISLNEPYKLCDFRPSYGEIFAEYIKEYDFWGYTDVDMIYGDIRHFITEELLESYDRILGLGHFSLFRNVARINSLYRYVEQPTYRQVYSYPCGCAFDEYWGLGRYMDKEMHDKFYQAYPFDDIDCMKFSFQAHMRKCEDEGKSHFIYSYENGKLYRIFEKEGMLQKEQTMYVHFQKRPMKVKAKAENMFMMVPNAYIPYMPKLSLDKLFTLSKTKFIYVHAYKLRWKRVINKIIKIKENISRSKCDIPSLSKDSGKYYMEGNSQIRAKC